MRELVSKEGGFELARPGFAGYVTRTVHVVPSGSTSEGANGERKTSHTTARA
jgi:hypothetical protein